MEEDTKSTYGQVVNLRNRLGQTFKFAHQEIAKGKLKQKKLYSKHSRKQTLDQGDRVLLLLRTERNKVILECNGSFTVIARKNAVDHVIDLGTKQTTFDLNMLKKYEERTTSGKEVSVIKVLNWACW